MLLPGNSCSCICNNIRRDRIDGSGGTVAEWIPTGNQLVPAAVLPDLQKSKGEVWSARDHQVLVEKV